MLNSLTVSLLGVESILVMEYSDKWCTLKTSSASSKSSMAHLLKNLDYVNQIHYVVDYMNYAIVLQSAETENPL